MCSHRNEDQILTAKTAFGRADADSDGYCSIEELKTVFKELGQDCTEEDIKGMCDEFCEETRKPNTLQVCRRDVTRLCASPDIRTLCTLCVATPPSLRISFRNSYTLWGRG